MAESTRLISIPQPCSVELKGQSGCTHLSQAPSSASTCSRRTSALRLSYPCSSSTSHYSACPTTSSSDGWTCGRQSTTTPGRRARTVDRLTNRLTAFRCWSLGHCTDKCYQRPRGRTMLSRSATAPIIFAVCSSFHCANGRRPGTPIAVAVRGSGSCNVNLSWTCCRFVAYCDGRTEQVAAGSPPAVRRIPMWWQRRCRLRSAVHLRARWSKCRSIRWACRMRRPGPSRQ